MSMSITSVTTRIVGALAAAVAGGASAPGSDGVSAFGVAVAEGNDGRLPGAAGAAALSAGACTVDAAARAGALWSRSHWMMFIQTSSARPIQSKRRGLSMTRSLVCQV
jgi:hypothetical protein